MFVFFDIGGGVLVEGICDVGGGILVGGFYE